MRSRGSTASTRTIIPIPPSHCVKARQIRSERGSDSTSVTTLDAVVVKPAIDSKKASTGRSSWPLPAKMYGSAPKMATRSQVRATTR
jgi:hypothetical protein